MTSSRPFGKRSSLGSHSPTLSHQKPAAYQPASTQKYSQPALCAASISGISFAVVGFAHRQFM